MKRGAWLLGLLVLVLTACPNPGPPDFELRVDPNGLTLHQGERKTISLIVVPVRGFKGTLRLGLEGAPEGVSLSPESVEVTGSGENRFDLTLEADSSATPGNYSLTLQATQGKVRHTTGLALTLLPPAGTLDTAFGSEGVATLRDALQAQGADDIGHSLAIDDSGNILVLGESTDSGGQQRLVLVRFTAQGEVDTSFGTQGVVQSEPINAEVRFDLDQAVAVLPSGKILIAGYTTAGTHAEDALLCRFNADGSPDTSFGSNGCAYFDSLAGGNGNDRAYALLPTADGTLFTGFSYKDTQFAVQAFLAKASPDGKGLVASFADQGVRVGGDEDYDAGYSLAALPDGYVVAGTTKGSGNYEMLIAKTDLNGALDPGFGDQGVLTLGGLGGGENDRAYSTAVTPEGRIVVAGYTDTVSGNDVNLDAVVVMLEPDGTRSSDFGNHGVRILGQLGGGSQDGGDLAYSVTVDSEGRILVAGETYVGNASKTDYDLFVARLRPNGELDPSFGQDGIFVWDGGHGDDRAFEVTLDGQGWILVTGFTTGPGGDEDLVLLRLVP